MFSLLLMFSYETPRLQRLKLKFCLYRSIDRYDTNPSGQGTFYSGHKITDVIWPVGFSKDLSTLDV